MKFSIDRSLSVQAQKSQAVNQATDTIDGAFKKLPWYKRTFLKPVFALLKTILIALIEELFRDLE